jgi:F-type H+-transporting ATPase subunit gamma
METLESLSNALDAMGDIQAIVRTMKALSSVSIRQYENAEAAMSDYVRTVELGLMAVLRQRQAAGLALPGLDHTEGNKALIVVGSDRGLCGGYNDKITRFAQSHMGGGPVDLGIIGLRVAARFEADGVPLAFAQTLPGSVEGLARLVQNIIVEIDHWTQGQGVGQVWLLHNRRDGRITAKPRAHHLLPLPNSYLRKLSDADWPGRSLPLFRMDCDRLMSWLVQQRLFVVIYRALAEALASEHASRLAAMHAAERNIEERRDALKQLYRQRRQQTITRELLDVVSGFEAVSKADRAV